MKFLSYFTRSNNDRPVDRAQLIIDEARDIHNESVAPAISSAAASSAAASTTTAAAERRREIGVEGGGNVAAKKKKQKRSKSSKDSSRKNNDRPVDKAQLIIDEARDIHDESVAPAISAAAIASSSAAVTTTTTATATPAAAERRTEVGVEDGGDIAANKKKKQKRAKNSKDSSRKKQRNNSDESDGQNGRQRKDRGDKFLSYFTRTTSSDHQADTVHLFIADHDVAQDEPTTTTTTSTATTSTVESFVLEAADQVRGNPQGSWYDEYSDKTFLLVSNTGGEAGNEPLLDSEESGRCVSDGEGPELCSSSVEIIEVNCVEEVQEDGEATDKKKKRKLLRKKVRKRVWRVMRSSWKYLRIGFTGYAPGFAAMFTWGVTTSMEKAGVKMPTAPQYF